MIKDFPKRYEKIGRKTSSVVSHMEESFYKFEHCKLTKHIFNSCHSLLVFVTACKYKH
jgi:hypothetical protein